MENNFCMSLMNNDGDFCCVKVSVCVCSGWSCPVLAGLTQECQLFKHKPMKTHACGLWVCLDPAALRSRMRYQLFEKMCSVSVHIILSVVSISACTSLLIPHMGARSPPLPLVCVRWTDGVSAWLYSRGTNHRCFDRPFPVECSLHARFPLCSVLKSDTTWEKPSHYNLIALCASVYEHSDPVLHRAECYQYVLYFW